MSTSISSAGKQNAGPDGGGGSGNGFRDAEMDWGSTAASSISAGGFPTATSAGGKGTNAIGNAHGRTIVSDEFLDDFDDDDDAFFASTTAAYETNEMASNANEGSGVSSLDIDTQMGVSHLVGPASASSFGMLTFTHTDVASASASRSTSANARPSPSNDIYGSAAQSPETGYGDDVLDEDDGEMMELERRHLVHLRNTDSPHRVVAQTCLVLNQFVYSADFSSTSDNDHSPIHNKNSEIPIQIQSSSIYHVQRYQRLTHRILSALTSCLKSHHSPTCRAIASRTLASAARASYARLRFDAKLMSVRLPASIATRLEDECGNGAAYTLLSAALDDEDDVVSSSALEALGILTLDSNSDNFAAEVRGIAECSNPNLFMYENDSRSCWILEQAHAMRELQSKAWSNVVFPRMHRLLHRISLYASKNHLAKALPIVTAVFVHAITRGPETVPARRTMQTGKDSHGKRGWMETDAEGLARDFVEEILNPIFVSHNLQRDGCNQSNFDGSNKGLLLAASLACVRMSSVCPNAPWKLLSCRNAVAVLNQQLNDEMNMGSPAFKGSWNSSQAMNTSNENSVQQLFTSSPISTPMSFSPTPAESLAGMAAMLVIAIRGIPLHERAQGLVTVLRVALIFLPLGIRVPNGGVSGGGTHLDVPVTFSQAGNFHDNCSFRLSRVGLLTEVALAIMFGGTTNIDHLVAKEYISIHTSEPEKEFDKEPISGTRAVLLNHVLQSKMLASVWEKKHQYCNDHQYSYHPVDEMVWVFCSVSLQIFKQNEELFSDDPSLAVEWSNIGLVLLDNFAKITCNCHHQSYISKPSSSAPTISPFANAGHAAYTDLFSSLLKCSGFIASSSISIGMLPASFLRLEDPAQTQQGMPLTGGEIPRALSVLSKIATAMVSIWNKSRHTSQSAGNASLLVGFKNISLTMLIVDAWLSRCIINHDSNQSNEAQLELGPMLLSLLRSEMNILLDTHKEHLRAYQNDVLSNISDERLYVEMILHLFQVCVACVETMACLSVLLSNAENGEAMDGISTPEKRICPLALSILNGLSVAAKDGAVEVPQLQSRKDAAMVDSLLNKQIAVDADEAMLRIKDCIVKGSQFFHEQLAPVFEVSPLAASEHCPRRRQLLQSMFHRAIMCPPGKNAAGNGSTSFKSSSTVRKIPSVLDTSDQAVFFLFHHARLVLAKRTSLSMKSYNHTSSFSGVLSLSRLVKPRNPLHLQDDFVHTTIVPYQRVGNMPILVPERQSYSSETVNSLSGVSSGQAIAVTGSSEPVSLTVSHGTRRVRTSDLSESESLVVTMRLYNITPVSLRNGVRLGATIVQDCGEARRIRLQPWIEDGSVAVASALYKNEIKAGDCLTWEIALGHFGSNNLSLQPSITFRQMEQERITHKLMSGGEVIDGDIQSGEGEDFIVEEEEPTKEDITIHCQNVALTSTDTLQPCPLVFFSSFDRCEPGIGIGDSDSFQYIWSILSFETMLALSLGNDISGEKIESKALYDERRGHVILPSTNGDNHTSSGCAFTSPDGNRIFCKLSLDGNLQKQIVLHVRSNSCELLLSCVGKPESQKLFLQYAFGRGVTLLENQSGVSSNVKKSHLGHDFPSMTMKHSPVHVSSNS